MKFKLDRSFILLRHSLGFTLVELLIAIALTTIIVAGIGIGLVNILQANERTEAETASRNNLNRALDFISDDIRTANRASESPPPGYLPSYLGTSGSPAPKLYLQIPLPQPVQSMTAADELIALPNHGLSNRDPVIFTGNGTIADGLLPDTTYFVTDRTTNTFKVANSPGGAALNLTKDSSGSLTANRLVIYYTRTSTNTWLEPNTINRSIRPCAPDPETNCPALVDSIADEGLKADVTSDARQVTLNLIGQISDSSDPVVKLEVATTTVFTRNNP